MVVSATDELSNLSGTSFTEGAEELLSKGPERGPMAIYLKGIRDRTLRLDDRQEATMQMLQRLHDQLWDTRKRSSSGLTVVGTALAPPEKPSWCGTLPGCRPSR
jgi:predicted ATPase